MQSGTRVRLLRDLRGVPAASEGRVIGAVKGDDGNALTIVFDHGPSRIVEPDDIEEVLPDEEAAVRAPARDASGDTTLWWPYESPVSRSAQSTQKE